MSDYLYTVVIVYALFFLPPIIIAWDAWRRGHSGLVWWLAGIAGPLWSVLGSLSMNYRDPLTATVIGLLGNPLSYAMIVVLLSYLISRPWRYPVVRNRGSRP
jgi:hypothetical protein